MAFILGFLGAVIGVMLLGITGAAGWILRGVYDERCYPDCPQPGETEQKRMAEQQQAINCLQNYSAERAYGLVGEEHGWRV